MKKLFILSLISLFVAVLILPNYSFAAGSATLSLSPSNGTYSVGDIVNVQIRENSGAEEVNAVQTNILYDSNVLNYTGVDDTGTAFPVVAETTNLDGNLKLARGLSGASGVTGEQLVTTVSFRFISPSGSSALTFDNESAIARITDSSDIWNGVVAGSSYSIFQDFSNPRWMQLNKDAYKVDVTTGLEVESVIPAGTTFKFESKIIVNDNLCYRTSDDTAGNELKCIWAADIQEIQFIPSSEPLYMELNKNTYKIGASSLQQVDSQLSVGRHIMFGGSAVIDNRNCLRTSHDTSNNFSKCIWEADIDEIQFVPFSNPRWMQLNKDTYKRNPLNGTALDLGLAKDMQIKFTSKIVVNKKVYYRTEHDTNGNLIKGISSEDVTEIPYEPMVAPRYLTTKEPLKKKIPNQEIEVDGTLDAGRAIYFKDKIRVNNVTYLRTAYDSDRGIYKGIELSKLQ